MKLSLTVKKCLIKQPIFIPRYFPAWYLIPFGEISSSSNLHDILQKLVYNSGKNIRFAHINLRKKMRICSFLPSTTEIICALGSENELVGITHECNYPPSVLNKNRVVMSSIELKGLSSPEIDEMVTRNAREGKSTYLVDPERLKEADPDIIFTQGLCEVCAVSGNQVLKTVEILNKKPEVVSLEPRTVDEVLESIVTVGESIGKSEEADELKAKLPLT